MPAKWKIFLALNFVLSLPALILFIVLFINVITIYNSYPDYLLALVFLFSLLMISLNGLLNIFMLQRFFPDKLVPTGMKRLNRVSLVINMLVAIALLLLCIYGAIMEFGDNRYEREDYDSSGKIALAVLFFFWIVQVFVLIMQAQLIRRISRNNREKMDSLIDSIGK